MVELRMGVTCSYFLDPVSRRAAAFCPARSRCNVVCGSLQDMRAWTRHSADLRVSAPLMATVFLRQKYDVLLMFETCLYNYSHCLQ